MLYFLFYLSLFSCLIGCGVGPLNRVPPKTEFYYTKDDPCSRGNNEVRDNVESGGDQEIPQEIQPDPDQSRSPASDEPAESLRMGEWRSRYAPPILGGYDSIERPAYGYPEQRP